MKILKHNIEKIVLFFIGLSFFVGIWHALPMSAVINDESYFVGGVLRSMENHTIIPAVNDIPYGTVTYILNYLMSLVTISVLLPFFNFSLVGLKIFLVQNPSIMYLSLRFLSGLIGVLTLFLVNKILKKEIEDVKTRIFLLILLFTNIITVTIFHTGKVWVVAAFLVIVSFYYLYKALIDHDLGDNVNSRKNILISIIFSFIALADFPLNLFCLINIPIAIYFFRKDKKFLYRLIFYIFIGVIAFLFITLLNFHSILNQVVSVFKSTGEHPINSGFFKNLNFLASFKAFTFRVFLLFPLIIFTFFLNLKEGIKNNKLFIISSTYFLTYFFSIVVVANWNMELELSLRYVFPLGFFLLFATSSLNIKFKNIFYILIAISLVYNLYTLYYLSIPTTYNNAFNWIKSNLSQKDVTIVNPTRELQLIKNKKSQEFTREEFCVTKCKNTIKFNLNSDFIPLVLDKDSKSFDILKIKGDVYYIDFKEVNIPGFVLIKTFSNQTKDYHSVDYNMGSYFDMDYFKIKNLGKNIFIYYKKS